MFLDGNRLDRDQRVSVVRDLAAALAGIHELGVVHGAVHPGNVLVHPATERVSLTGFDVAWRLSEEMPEASGVGPALEMLAYLAPEQSGRTSGVVGVQADLYSLGALLYEMLTGRVPFQAAGETEMIHAQIARMPLAPFVVDPGVPRALSDMVMKLLAKTPEERYRSARGLQADLDTWLDGAAGPGFVPGSRDVADEVRIPEKLYGRARELDVLKQSFDRVCGGAAERLLVAGYSGVGKSSLVRATGASAGPVPGRPAVG